MSGSEKLPPAELASWLKHYRTMGFKHLYRKPSMSENSGDAPGTTVASSTTHPEANAPDLTRPSSATAASLFESVTPRETLEKIREDLGDCRRCKLAGGRKTIVFGSGNPKADIVFVGEGPGADEDEQGLPFVGRAGQLLTQMIEKGMKIPRSEVYICNIIKCRPPGNRKPEKEEVAACRPFVERQIDAVRPRVIVALGATAVAGSGELQPGGRMSRSTVSGSSPLGGARSPQCGAAARS